MFSLSFSLSLFFPWITYSGEESFFQVVIIVLEGKASLPGCYTRDPWKAKLALETQRHRGSNYYLVLSPPEPLTLLSAALVESRRRIRC